jgi:hypothetical protein
MDLINSWHDVSNELLIMVDLRVTQLYMVPPTPITVPMMLLM